MASRLWYSFKNASSQYSESVHNAVSKYELSLVRGSDGDSKRFHKYIRYKKVNRPTTGFLERDGE